MNSHHLLISGRKFMHHRFLRASCLFFCLLFLAFPSHAQQLSIDTTSVISGVINNVNTKVTNVLFNYYANKDAVVVNDTTGFRAGNAVMIMQMKTDTGYLPAINSFGDTIGKFLNNPGYAGTYDILKIAEVVKYNNIIVFSTKLSNRLGVTFDASEYVQLIRVPIYRNAIVKGAPLTCKAWDPSAGTGGVLSFLVMNTLSLDTNMDVSGKGFKGADPGSEIYTGTCSTSNPAAYAAFDYPGSVTNRSGRKGEGALKLKDSWSKGYGCAGTSPGGGNGKLSGGGGGCNFGSGGNGGYQISSCTFGIDLGGRGGYGNSNLFNRQAFMGSGGGSGTQLVANVATKGGDGGGIIIFMATTVNSSDHSIIARGANAGNVSAGGGGSGGGGGGGTILMDVEKINGLLSLSVRGGNGSSIAAIDSAGPGGGGGIGVIHYNGAASDNVLKTQVDDSTGIGGIVIPDRSSNWHHGANDGEIPAGGFFIDDVNLRLIGFYFNYLPPDDSVCLNSPPDSITGSLPRGGSVNYTYEWDYRKDSLDTWQVVQAFSPTAKNYLPPANIFPQMQFRRIVQSDVYDTSEIFTRHVFHPIDTNYIVNQPDTVVCYGTVPGTIHANKATSSGSETSYQWQGSQPDSLSFHDIAGPAGTGRNYTPDTTKVTTYYRRVAGLGGCKQFSKIVRIKVLPQITGNLIDSDQTVCYNFQPKTLKGAAILSGGDSHYYFTWQKSADKSSWNTATGTNNDSVYTPPPLTSTTYYRRYIESGPGTPRQCKNTSDVRTIIVLPLLSNYSIAANQTICGGTIPARFTGNKPSGGDPDSVWYRWQYNSVDTAVSADWLQVNVPLDSVSLTYGTALYDTTWFRRVVLSGHNYACRDTSTVVVNVHTKLTNLDISATSEICSGQDPGISANTPKGGINAYSYKWYKSNGGSFAAISGGTGLNYDPGALTSSQVYWFYYREVKSGVCDANSDTIKIHVLSPVTGNSITGQAIACYDDSPMLTGNNPLGGGDSIKYRYAWLSSTDGSGYSLRPDSQPSLTDNLIKKKTWYKRIVKSGLNDCCRDTSLFDVIDLYPITKGNLVPKDTTLCGNGNLPLQFSFEGTGPWSFRFSDSVKNVYEIHSLNNSITVNAIPAFSDDTVYKKFAYKLVALKDTNGCYAADTFLTGAVRALVYKFPFTFAAHPTDSSLVNVCGNAYRLQATKPGYDAITSMWIAHPSNPNDSIVSPNDESSNVFAQRLDSLYTGDTARLYWLVSNWHCPDSDLVTVVFHHKPSKFRLAYYDVHQNKTLSNSKDTSIYNSTSDVVFAVRPIPPDTGWWTAENPAIVISNPGSYTTEVSNLSPKDNNLTWHLFNDGCGEIASNYDIHVNGLHAWSGFSPGSGLNDYFWVEGIELEPGEVTVTVLSSSGKMVYQYTGRGSDWGGGSGWDGKGNRIDNNGQNLPDGTYYYIVKTNSETLKGYLLLRRSGK